jgi:hypothetical protein
MATGKSHSDPGLSKTWLMKLSNTISYDCNIETDISKTYEENYKIFLQFSTYNLNAKVENMSCSAPSYYSFIFY